MSGLNLQLAIRVHQSAGESGQGGEKSTGTAWRPGDGNIHAYKHAYNILIDPRCPCS